MSLLDIEFRERARECPRLIRAVCGVNTPLCSDEEAALGTVTSMVSKKQKCYALGVPWVLGVEEVEK